MEGEDRISLMERLKLNLSRHSERATQSLDWAVSVGESLRKNFDTYVNSELNDLREQIDILKLGGYPVEREDSELNDLEIRFEKVNNRLNELLESAKKGKVRSINISKKVKGTIFPRPKSHDTAADIFDLDILIEGFYIIGELEDVRKSIERWSLTHIRNIEQTISVVRELYRRGDIGYDKN